MSLDPPVALVGGGGEEAPERKRYVHGQSQDKRFFPTVSLGRSCPGLKSFGAEPVIMLHIFFFKNIQEA